MAQDRIAWERTGMPIARSENRPKIEICRHGVLTRGTEFAIPSERDASPGPGPAAELSVMSGRVMRQILETVSRWPGGKPPPRDGGEDFPSTAGVPGPSPLSAAGRTGRRDETPAEGVRHVRVGMAKTEEGRSQVERGALQELPRRSRRSRLSVPTWSRRVRPSARSLARRTGRREIQTGLKILVAWHKTYM